MNDYIWMFYDETEFKNILSNKSKFFELVDNRFNRIDDKNRLDVLESFIMQCYRDKKHSNLIKNYVSFIYEKYKSNPYIILDSRLFDEKYIRNFLDTSRITNINNFKRIIGIKYSKMIENISPGTKLDDNLLRYAISLIGNSTNSFINKTYKYLLNNLKYNKTVLAYEFILKYTAYISAKELKINNATTYFTNYDFVNHVSLDCFGKSFPKYGIILLNKTKIDRKHSILDLIQTAGHEMKHMYQQERYSKGEISKNTFDWLVYHILCKYDKHEYDKNYDNLEVELDANNYGWDLAGRIFSTYTKNYRYVKACLSRKKEVLLKQAVNFKKSSNEEDIEEDYKYNINRLDQVVKNNPSLIQNYGILGYLYDVTGKRASFYSLVHAENTLISKDHNKYNGIGEIFKCYYIDAIDKGEKIDLSGINTVFKRQIVNKMIDLEIGELEEISHILTLNKIVSDKDSSRINHKIKLKLKRISKIMDFLNKNNETIYNFRSGIINTKINKLLVLIDKLNIDIDMNLAHKIFYRKNTYDIQASGYKLQKSLRRSPCLSQKSSK